MDPSQGLNSGGWCPATSTSASASEPPPESSVTHELLLDSTDDCNSYGGAQEYSLFSGSQTLESGFDRLDLSDSNACRPRHQPQPPVWNSSLYQGFSDTRRINVDGYRNFPTVLETDRAQQIIQRFQRLIFQNSGVNGSFGFDDSKHSSSLTAQDRMLSNGFRNGSLGEVPSLPRNNSVLDQSPWATSHSPMFRDPNLGRNKVSSSYCPNVASLQNPANTEVMTPKHRMSHQILCDNIEKGPMEMFNLIFNNVVSHICELMVDPFGHRVVQKLIERSTDEQITQILGVVTRNPLDLVHICNESHGTRSIQALLSFLRSQQQISCFMSALSPVALPLTMNANGNHVIEHCLRHFSPQDNMHLLELVAQHFDQVALDQYGCCLLQDCIRHSTGELKQRLINKIISNSLECANHCYGNYLVQFVLDRNDPRAASDLLRQLEGSYRYLASEKYGSHVVQSVLRHLGKEGSAIVVLQLLPDISKLLIDQYGNYVVQTMWAVSKSDIREMLKNAIRQNERIMRCNRYGTIVLDKLNWL